MNVLEVSHNVKHTLLIPDRANDAENWQQFIEHLTHEVQKSGAALIEVRTMAGWKDKLHDQASTIMACKFWVSNEAEFVAREVSQAEKNLRCIKSDVGT